MLLDLRERCSFADFFVICSGDSSRQLRSIGDDIEKSLKQEGTLPHHREGSIESGWFLLDYGDVIIHIFSTEERDYYSLEELWNDAKVLLRVQ